MRATWVPPALLAAVAVLQIGLARTVHLTPWKGGGFGMFATLDHGAYRGVDVVVEGTGRSEALEIPPSLEAAAARAANCPSEWLLRNLARGVEARERRYEREVSRITLRAWRAEFDVDTLRPSTQTLRTFVYVARSP